jgi:hypothetical protein
MNSAVERLIVAIDMRDDITVEVEGHTVSIFGDDRLWFLEIDHQTSNKGNRSHIRTLLREWSEGKRKIVQCENWALLMVDHDYKEPATPIPPPPDTRTFEEKVKDPEWLIKYLDEQDRNSHLRRVK